MSLPTTLSALPSPSIALYLNTSTSPIPPAMITTSTTSSPHTFTLTADTIVLAALSLTTTTVSRHMEISELYYYHSATDNDWPANTDSRVYLPYSTWTRYIPATTLTSIVTSPVRTVKAGETLGAIEVVPQPSKDTEDQGTKDRGVDRDLMIIGIVFEVLIGGPFVCFLIFGCLGGCEQVYRDHRARQKRRAPVAPHCDAPQAPGGKGDAEGTEDIELGPLVQKPTEAVVRDDIGTVIGRDWVYEEAFQGSW